MTQFDALVSMRSLQSALPPKSPRWAVAGALPTRAAARAEAAIIVFMGTSMYRSERGGLQIDQTLGVAGHDELEHGRTAAQFDAVSNPRAQVLDREAAHRIGEEGQRLLVLAIARDNTAAGERHGLPVRQDQRAGRADECVGADLELVAAVIARVHANHADADVIAQRRVLDVVLDRLRHIGI